MDWLDRIKLILAVVIAAAGVAAYYVLADASDLVRVLVVVAAPRARQMERQRATGRDRAPGA